MLCSAGTIRHPNVGFLMKPGYIRETGVSLAMRWSPGQARSVVYPSCRGVWSDARMTQICTGLPRALGGRSL